MSDQMDRISPTDLLSVASVDQLLTMAANAIVRRGADKATAQLVARPQGALALIAHVGFEERFVEHFAIVEDEGSACGRALAGATIVQVPDVADHPVFNGTESQVVMLDAGSRSCTSFPLFDADGHVAGVVSAHYREPGPHDVEQVMPIIAQVQQLLASAGPAEHDDRPPLARVENLQLRQALSTRGLIGMAKGILMSSSNVDEDEAFRMLVRASQRENVRLRDICARLVAHHHRRIGDGSTDPRGKG